MGTKVYLSKILLVLMICILPASVRALTAADCSKATVRCVDDTAGATQEYKTVQSCADVAMPGDVCLVFPGNYPEYVQSQRAGTSGAPISFIALQSAKDSYPSRSNVSTIEGVRIKYPYIVVEGFDITKYPNGASPGHITVEPGGSFCAARKNVFRDGVQLQSKKYSFNSATRTISTPDGGFLSAGFRPGTIFYVASNINSEIKNANIMRTIESVTDTTITVIAGQTLIDEGLAPGAPVMAIIYATRPSGGTPNRVGISGISMTISSSQQSTGCVFSDNRFYNLAGMAIVMMGENHVAENNIIENMHGWGIMDMVGNNLKARYNIIRNSPRYDGFFPPDGTGPDQSAGGHWDFVAPVFRLLANASVDSNDALIEYNFVDNVDNELFNVNENYLTNDPLTSKIVYMNRPASRFKFRYNVISRLEMHGASHRPDSVFENNTFVRSAVSAGSVFDSSSGTPERNVGSAEGTIVRNNIFVECGKTPDTYGAFGYYDVERVTNYFADYNFVAGPQSEGFPAKRSFVGKELHGVNGGDPLFQNIDNPIGPDGIPFTADDGLRPYIPTSGIANSIVCGKAHDGGDIGAYVCAGTRPLFPRSPTKLKVAQ